MIYTYLAIDDGLAHTLDPRHVFGPGYEGEEGEHSFTHEDGWTIKGTVSEDWVYWVNDFEATHPNFGWVRGNFEIGVRARSKRGFDHFLAHHAPDNWDYYDI